MEFQSEFNGNDTSWTELPAAVLRAQRAIGRVRSAWQRNDERDSLKYSFVRWQSFLVRRKRTHGRIAFRRDIFPSRDEDCSRDSKGN